MNALQNGSRFSLLPVEQFAQEMNRMMENQFGMGVHAHHGDFHMPVSIWEDDTHYFFEFDLPGVSKEGLEVKVVDNTLHISAERTLNHQEKSENSEFLRQERHYGRLERTFKLNAKIDEESINAELTDGVLRVTMTKAPESQVKKIEIK